MCGNPGFVVPFRGHKQSIFGIIVKDPKIFRMANEHWFQLKSPAALAPSKRVS